MRKLIVALLFIPGLLIAQGSRQPDAAQIALKLRKLNVLGSVLYVAAHPDDENTSIISLMSKGRLVETAYLSMTRGDGGQNLIGPEIRDMLGLIRTQELLSARVIDGGTQFFTRANDFGYSKSATETFQIWNKEEILSDVVKVFRQYQPDVVITRFPPDERAGHGHHTGSAILAQEAFDAAALPQKFPELTKELGTWQAKRLYTNTGRWWNTSINEETPGIVVLNVGEYSPLLGTSYSEIAAVSRSQHKSQGFGSSGSRGEQLEFLEYIKGERAESDLFEGINTSWSRIKNTGKIQTLVTKAIADFDVERPEKSVPVLMEIREEIQSISPGVWKKRKLAEVEQIIQDCLGLFISASADNYWIAPGQHVDAAFELVNRSNMQIEVQKIVSGDLALDSTVSILLNQNQSVHFNGKFKIRSSKSYSDPYWIKEPHSVGLFTVADPHMIGQPENIPAIMFTFDLKIAGTAMRITRPLQYKWTDRVKGEQVRPMEVVPPVFVNLDNHVLIFSDLEPKDVSVTIKSSSESELSGNLTLKLPVGWRSEPTSIGFKLSTRGEEDTKHFKVFPAQQEVTATLLASAEIDGKKFSQSVQLINYDHIPIQTVLPRAEAKLVRVNIKKEGQVIGYVSGAGDEVPAALRTMGYEVWEMKNEEVTQENLKRVDAVVLGIRALNANERIPFLMTELLKYVKEGGTMVVQYNTNGGLDKTDFSPYPISVSRARVTDEEATVRYLEPDHMVLTTPNKITDKDFEGWVQERGLYFPGTWDAHYDAILSMNDKGDEPQDGSLLVAKYGQGYYIYTGLSFFRELPEGVSGAYKLFANLVSAGKSSKPQTARVDKE
jgi:LmbE family N-acetylglucosaminyl deacetylase